ncbi:MAG TPA: response regulator [Thermoguttaceae bacterium]|nr:response regulator [Thermoguttaceae bacterium]
MSTRVLVADDSKLIRTMISDTVRDFGIQEIVEAVDGQEAVAAFQQNGFDLVILDWQMPGVCGLEVIETIRATGSQVPIIMVTATGTQSEHVVDAVEAGATDYLLKPFAPSALREKISRYCGPLEANEPAAAPQANAVHDTPASTCP